jgi:hypothetical protein
MLIRLEFITAVLGSRASNNATTQQSVRREPTASNVRKGTAMDHYRKISAEMQSAETDILSRLRREAAERAHDFEELTSGRSTNGYTSPIDPDFYNEESPSERHRKKSYLGRLEEDDQYSRPVSYRSGDAYKSGDTYRLGDSYKSGDAYRSGDAYKSGDTYRSGDAYKSGDGYRSGDSDGRSNRHVTRRSISRELHDYTSPSWATSSPVDFSRSSRERSLGRDLDPIADVERRIANRRSESLSRPSLASQGRSLTQNELGSSGSTTGARRLSSGLRSPLTITDDDMLSRISNSSKLSSTALDDRNRADWRRVSVPERGKDFKSLSKKYNR